MQIIRWLHQRRSTHHAAHENKGSHKRKPSAQINSARVHKKGARECRAKAFKAFCEHCILLRRANVLAWHADGIWASLGEFARRGKKEEEVEEEEEEAHHSGSLRTQMGFGGHLGVTWGNCKVGRRMGGEEDERAQFSPIIDETVL